MSKLEFKQILEDYGLSVNEFLFLYDAWNSLSYSDRLDLVLTEEENNE